MQKVFTSGCSSVVAIFGTKSSAVLFRMLYVEPSAASTITVVIIDIVP